MQDNADASLAEISLQATQHDGSLLSLTLALPLCNELFCPEPFFFQTSSAMMQTLMSAATLGVARLTVQATGPYGQQLQGDIVLDCNVSPLTIPQDASLQISCPLSQAPVAYQIPKVSQLSEPVQWSWLSSNARPCLQAHGGASIC